MYKVHKGGTVQALSCRHQWTAQCMYSLQGLWSAYAILSVCCFYWHREKNSRKKNEGGPSSVRLFSLSLLEKTLLTFPFFLVFLKRLFKNSLIKWLAMSAGGRRARPVKMKAVFWGIPLKSIDRYSGLVRTKCSIRLRTLNDSSWGRQSPTVGRKME